MKNRTNSQVKLMRASTIALATTTLLIGCGKSEPAGGPAFRVAVAPLTLPGVTNACYRVTVSNGPDRTGDIVWQQDSLCADDFGDGVGALAYVGPCDAGVATQNSVTIELLDLMSGATPTPIDDDEYDNPCGEIADWSGDRTTLVAGEDNYGPCTINKTCVENRDVAVTFELTIMRDANQGFFDIAVEFDDIFCSAKLDCKDKLLHDGDGDRGATAVVAFACTAGENEETYIYISDLILTCDGTPAMAPMLIPASASSPGQHGPISPGIFEWAAYQGDEQLTSNGEPLEKCFWNRAIGLDLASLQGRKCTLSGVGTASEVPLTPALLTAEGTSYPMVTWSVDVLTADGALCGANPLNGDGSGVQTSYIGADTDPQVLAALTGGAMFACGVDAAVPVTCAAGPTVGSSASPVTVSQIPSGTEQAIEVSVGGASTLIPLQGNLAGYVLGTSCCQHECCGTP